MPDRRAVPFFVALTLVAAGCPRPDENLAVPGGDAGRTSLPHNDLHHNSLTAEALHGNAELRAFLAEHELSAKTMQLIGEDERLKGEIADGNALQLMSYVVSCALAPGHGLQPPAGVQAKSPKGEVLDGWLGELGLCADWETKPPSAACLQIVSSCVIARVNAHDRRVIISMRGTPAALYPAQPQVPVETALRENDGTPIASFTPLERCGNLPSGGTAARSCGYDPLFVGRCQAGESVTVCTGGKASGSCACDDPITEEDRRATLRVCKGLYGCDAEEFSPPVAYAGRLPAEAACADKKRPALTFTCPENGPLVDPAGPSTGARYGYYSVMIGPGDLAPDQAPPPQVHEGVGATTGDYPAGEEIVFTYREGSFYGDLFSSTQLKVQPQILAGDAFACFSDVWTDGLAALTDRFCAGTTECFENVPHACTEVCARDDGMPGRYYENCRGKPSGAIWIEPVTVYLNHPCDLSKNCDKQSVAIGDAPPSIPPQ